MKKNMNMILKKCKSLSMQLRRSSSYTSLGRSDSTKLRGIWGGHCRDLHHHHHHHHHHLRLDGGGNDCDDSREEERSETIIYVRTKRRRYIISSEFLSHPLLSALIDKSSEEPEEAAANGRRHRICIRCEVVLFDHLLWLLQNGDLTGSLEELADLYVL